MTFSSLTKDMPIVTNDAVYDPKVDRVPMEIITAEMEKRYVKEFKKTFEKIRLDGGMDAISMLFVLFWESKIDFNRITFQQGHIMLKQVLSNIIIPAPPPAPFAHIRLPCPSCGNLHLDEGEWATKPHHTHACQHCGNVWRPAIINTCGVQFLPGYKNEN